MKKINYLIFGIFTLLLCFTSVKAVEYEYRGVTRCNKGGVFTKNGYTVCGPSRSSNGYSVPGLSDVECPSGFSTYRLPDDSDYIGCRKIKTDSTYTLTFNTNGGSSIPSQTFKYGDTLNVLNRTYQTGCTLQYWQDEIESRYDDGKSKLPNRNLTLKAIWSCNNSGSNGSQSNSGQYTLTFDTNGGSSIPSQTFNYRDTLNVLNRTLKTDCTLQYWQDDRGNPYYDGTTKLPNYNLTLHAVWSCSNSGSNSGEGSSGNDGNNAPRITYANISSCTHTSVTSPITGKKVCLTKDGDKYDINANLVNRGCPSGYGYYELTLATEGTGFGCSSNGASYTPNSNNGSNSNSNNGGSSNGSSSNGGSSSSSEEPPRSTYYNVTTSSNADKKIEIANAMVFTGTLAGSYDFGVSNPNGYIIAREAGTNNYYNAYCRTPGVDLQTGTAYDAYLISTNTTDKDLNAFNAGIIAIIAKSELNNKEVATKYANGIGMESAVKGVANAAATSNNATMALRLYEILMNKNKFKNNNRINYYSCYAKTLGDNASFKSKFEKLGIDTSKITCPSGYSVNASSYRQLSSVNEMLQIGLDAAISFKAGTSKAIATVSDLKKSESDGFEELSSDTSKGVKTIYYEVTATGFSDKGTLNAKLDCPLCNTYGKVNYYVLKNGEYVSFSASDNLLSNVQSNGVLKLKIEIIINDYAKYNSSNCPKVNYSLNVDYSDPSIDVQVYKIDVSNSRLQDFYVGLYAADSKYTLTEGNTSDSSGASFKLCGPSDEDCNSWKQECLEGNIESCNKYQLPKNKCIYCGTSMSNNVCSPNAKTISLVEGKEYENASKTGFKSSTANIVGCVIGAKDIVGNTYLDSQNKYCNVYCKEDYDFVMPGSDNHADEYRIIGLEAKITGTKSCYTTKIKYDEYLSDRRNGVANADAELRKCTNLSVNYTMNPSITAWFEKDSQAMNEILNKESSSTVKYSSLTDDSYNGATTNIESNTRYVKATKTITKTYQLETIYCAYNQSFATLKKTGDTKIDNCSMLEHSYPVNESGIYNYSINVGNLGEYYDNDGSYGRVWGNDKSVITTLIGSSSLEKGIIKKNDNASNGVYVCTYTVEGGNTCTKPDGTKVDITNCLKTADKSTCEARLCPNSTNNYCNKPDGTKVDITECLKTNTKAVCEKTYCSEGTPPGNCSTDGNGNFYINNVPVTYKEYKEAGCCPDCLPYCAPGRVCYYKPKCETYNGRFFGPASQLLKDQETMDKKCNPDPNCPTCPITGTGSIVKRIKYRSITTNNINPNERELGTNWNYDEKENVSTALELKAYATTKEIEEKSETIYDVNYDNQNANKDMAVKVTLDGKMINYLKSYNKDNKKDGYLNNTLKCYDMTNNYSSNSDKKTYENIYCYSEVIDNIVDKYGDNIKFSVARPRTDADRKNTQKFSYFTSWSQAESNKWTITTERGLAYYQNKYMEIGVGPSWK